MKAMKSTHGLCLLAAGSALLAAQAVSAAEVKISDSTSLTIGGYIKFDTLYSRFSDGEVAQGTGRDFYVPSSIPVSTGSGQAYQRLDAHAKETRLIVKTDTNLDGHKLGTHIEADFISGQIAQTISGSGNEGVTNAYNPSLRRAFITFDNWLFGQEWTNFINLTALPETLDFVAFPSDGTVFGRQPQVRYSSGGLSLALENGETTVQNLSGTTAGNTDDNVLPDLTLRYAVKLGPADINLAGVARQLKIDNPAVTTAPTAPLRNDTAFGGGASLSGKITFGPGDDLRFMLNGGKGIGRYLALGTVADAAMNDVSHDLKPVKVYNGYMAYRHVWAGTWRSTFTISGFKADNETALVGTGVTRKLYSASANLLYSPVKPLTLGLEYRHAKREVDSSAEGKLDRVQFSAKYLF